MRVYKVRLSVDWGSGMMLIAANSIKQANAISQEQNSKVSDYIHWRQDATLVPRLRTNYKKPRVIMTFKYIE